MGRVGSMMIGRVETAGCEMDTHFGSGKSGGRKPVGVSPFHRGRTRALSGSSDSEQCEWCSHLLFSGGGSATAMAIYAFLHGTSIVKGLSFTPLQSNLSLPMVADFHLQQLRSTQR
ncbi:hypothetical protein CRG98_032167 [Punica granatum]|uniref:Uncharacterized protein n=1 Tax=Punica granatum TaxID=22663 RepID=A0A2I0ITX8_PUNGR|nr:hypothetical protein CRG98_032167 [Punica granatum]